MIKKKKEEVIQQLITETKKQAELLKIKEEQLKKKEDMLKENKEELIKNKEELEDLRGVERDYLEFVKKVANTNNGTTNNIKQVNMFFIVKEYKNADNFADRMDPPLTKSEEQYVLENGGVYGGYYILVKRCIEGVPMEDRPFHCVDESRNKYMLRIKDSWEIDNRGEKLLEGIYPRMLKLCCPKQIKSPDELDEWKKHNDYMVELSTGGENKILKMLNKVSLLKNNVIMNE